jgi:hypothetical protein
MNKWIILFVFITLSTGCNHKQKGKKIEGSIVSVVSFLKSQVKAVDTISHPILRIDKVENVSDTSTVSKAEFVKQAQAFLSLPDISTDERKENYEEAIDYDEVMNKVFMTYTATDEDEEIRRQTVISEPDEYGESKIKTVIVNRVQENKDSTTEQDMTWHTDRRFQIVTKTKKPNEPEKINILIIQWE